jgi:hypothetical protein
LRYTSPPLSRPIKGDVTRNARTFKHFKASLETDSNIFSTFPTDTGLKLKNPSALRGIVAARLTLALSNDDHGDNGDDDGDDNDNDEMITMVLMIIMMIMLMMMMTLALSSDESRTILWRFSVQQQHINFKIANTSSDTRV